MNETSREQVKLKHYKEDVVSLKNITYNKNRSILLKVAIQFLLTTLISLVIFWIAIGSQQIALISENAYLRINQRAVALLDKLTPFLENKKWQSQLDSEVKRTKAFETLQKAIENLDESSRLNNFVIVESHNYNILYSYKNKQIENLEKTKAVLPKDETSDLLKAFYLKDYKGKRFYGKFNIFKYQVTLYIPLSKKGIHDYVLKTDVLLPSIDAELQGLFRLAISMLVIIIVLQGVFIFALNRSILSPIKKLMEGVHNVSSGNFQYQIPNHKSPDELGLLIYIFNKMTLALKEKTEKLESILTDLEQRNRIIENELDMAQTIQQSLLPKSITAEHLDMSVYYEPLEKISGDYYDIFPFSDGSVGIFIADVSGHGVPAALVTILAKVYLNNMATPTLSPHEFLAEVNRDLTKLVTTSDYLSAFYMLLHPDLKLEYCNAAHQLVFIYRASIKQIIKLDTQGFFIAAIEDPPVPFETKVIQLERYDKIIMYTDGIIEGLNTQKEQYSSERFESQILNLGDLDVDDLSNALVKDFLSFTEGEPHKDDSSIVIIEVKNVGKTNEIHKIINTSKSILQNVEVSEEDKLFKKAVDLYKNKHFTEAFVFFEECLEKNINVDNTKKFLVNCYFVNEDFNSCINLLRKMVVDNPNHIPFVIKLAICYMKVKDIDQGNYYFSQAKAIDTQSIELYIQWSNCLLNKKVYSEALEKVAIGLELDPSNTKLQKIKEKIEKALS